MKCVKKEDIEIMIDHRQLKNVEYFSCLGSLITTDARYAHVKLNPGLTWQK
jgi:hypothetical protein